MNRGDHLHGGIDISAACGTPVLAAAAGRVNAARWSDTAGNMIVLDHGGGLDTRYFHLSRFAVSAGASVAQGQVIGYVGNTGRSRGCHLHWEVRQNGRALNPLTAAGPAPSPAEGQAGGLPVITRSGGDRGNAPVLVTAGGGRDEEKEGGGLAVAALVLIAAWLFF